MNNSEQSFTIFAMAYTRCLPKADASLTASHRTWRRCHAPGCQEEQEEPPSGPARDAPASAGVLLWAQVMDETRTTSSTRTKRTYGHRSTHATKPGQCRHTVRACRPPSPFRHFRHLFQDAVCRLSALRHLSPPALLPLANYELPALHSIHRLFS